MFNHKYLFKNALIKNEWNFRLGILLQSDLRETYKRLLAFAQEEYKVKRAISVSGYSIRQIKGLSKNIPVMQSYLSRQYLTFFIIADYKTESRIYFFRRDGALLGAENLEKGKIKEKTFKKYAKKMFKIPRISSEEKLEATKTAYHKEIKKIKGAKFNFTQFEGKFKRTFKDIKRKTNLNGDIPSISMIDKDLKDKERFFSIKKDNKIEYTLKILASDLLNGIIARDCLYELIPDYFGYIRLDLASFGALQYISKNERETWLKKWQPKPPLTTSYHDFEEFFKKLYYIVNFLDEIEENEDFLSIFLENLINNFKLSENLIANKVYTEANEKINHDLLLSKSILFQFLETKKKTEIKNDSDNSLIKCSLLLSEFKINEFLKTYQSLETVPEGIEKLFTIILETIKPFKLFQQIATDERVENARLFININFKNKSDLVFKILNYKVPAIIKEQNLIIPKDFPQKIYPFEEKSFNFMLKWKETDKIMPFKIKLEDDSGNQYIIKSNSIKFNKK